MKNKKKYKLENWHWPYQRINFGGDKEYSCPHGIGHGGIHGCDGCPCDLKTLVRQWLKFTPCERCGRTPIEYHNFDHINKPWRRVSSLVNRGSCRSVLKEIDQCQKLCRSCHMKEDGRLIKLQKNKPNFLGRRYPGKQCVLCHNITKPLRKKLCYGCYEIHRVGGRRFKGHSYSDGCCSCESYKKRIEDEKK